MGLIFYKLIVTNGLIISLQEIAVAFVMCKCFKKPPEMDGAKFFVNIIETQASVQPENRFKAFMFLKNQIMLTFIHLDLLVVREMP